MAETVSHRANVRDKLSFLHRLMDEFTGGLMSLEGDLSKCSFADDVVLTREEVGVLKRHTLSPQQDFVVFRLGPETLAAMFREVMAVGLTRAIIHVQIVRGGVLQPTFRY